MFSKLMNRAFLSLFCCLFGLFTVKAQTSAPKYVLRLIDTDGHASFAPAEKKLLATALDGLHKTNRIDVLRDAVGADTLAATHLLEALPSFAVVNNKFVVTGFNDSLGQVSFRYDYKLGGTVGLLLTEVETGRVFSNAAVRSEGEVAATYKLPYKDLGWTKTMVKTDEKLKASLVEKARPKLSGEFTKLFNSAIDELVKSNSRNAPAAANSLFRYRLEVLEATEIDKDDAEKVRIAGGTAFDLFPKAELVCYTTREIKSGSKTFEHFDVLGRLKFEKDAEKGAICDVSKGKEAILAALQAKKKVFCSVGRSPFTVAKSDQKQPQLAVASLIFPAKATEKTKDKLYRKLRSELLTVKNIELLERQKLAELQAEKDRQKREDFIDRATVDQYKSVGADLLLEVKFSEPVVKPGSDAMGRGWPEVDAQINFQARLLLVETGEVIEETTGRFSKNYGFDIFTDQPHPLIAAYKNSPKPSLDPFYQDVLASLGFGMNGFMRSALPPRIVVAEVTDTKKDRADEVLVVGDFNMANRDKYQIVRKRYIEVDGQKLPRFETIGLISLRDGEGDGVAEAKVKDGGKDILAAMQAGELLFCTDKLNWMERLSKWGDNRMEKYGY